MSKKVLIIQGSARSNGNTAYVTSQLKLSSSADIIDLKFYNYSGYDYDHQNVDDDFLSLMKRVVEYDIIIFATPVYWYSMSGLMKNFFDRITDCLKIDKDTGRKLRGKAMATVSCGSDSTETEGFFIPFRNSAAYLGMNYLGDVHVWVEEEGLSEVVRSRLNQFSTKLR